MAEAPSVTIRPVQPEDADNGLFDILSQLTQAPKLDSETFTKLVEAQRSAGNQLTVVAVDESDEVIATGAALIEPKFIRGGRSVGHIEDIVVDSRARGMHLGQRIIAELVEFCKGKDCYKVILDCDDDNIPFYEKCGFKPKERQMALYF